MELIFFIANCDKKEETVYFSPRFSKSLMVVLFCFNVMDNNDLLHFAIFTAALTAGSVKIIFIQLSSLYIFLITAFFPFKARENVKSNSLTVLFSLKQGAT